MKRGKEEGVPQHIRDNEESHMTSTDIHLVEMRDAAVAGSYGDVF